MVHRGATQSPSCEQIGVDLLLSRRSGLNFFFLLYSQVTVLLRTPCCHAHLFFDHTRVGEVECAIV